MNAFAARSGAKMLLLTYSLAGQETGSVRSKNSREQTKANQFFAANELQTCSSKREGTSLALPLLCRAAAQQWR